MHDCLIGLGSNMGDRADNLARAVQLLADAPGVAVRAVSDWIDSAPVIGIDGPQGQDPFLNGAIRLQTNLAPQDLLATMGRVEQKLARQRKQHWGPRTIDLDVLLVDHEIVTFPNLRIPHRWLAWRWFALKPANQVAADMIHPEIGWTIGQIWKHVRDSPQTILVVGQFPRDWQEVLENLLPSSYRLLDACEADPKGPVWHEPTCSSAKNGNNWNVAIINAQPNTDVMETVQVIHTQLANRVGHPKGTIFVAGNEEDDFATTWPAKLGIGPHLLFEPGEDGLPGVAATIRAAIESLTVSTS